MPSYFCPTWITFPAIGDHSIGFISIAQNTILPFELARVFWTYHTPSGVTRGRHAHYELEQILIAITGEIKIQTENRKGEKELFILDSPEKGLYLPPHYWHTMEYSTHALQLTLASADYTEADYIRSYEVFKNGTDPE